MKSSNTLTQDDLAIVRKALDAVGFARIAVDAECSVSTVQRLMQGKPTRAPTLRAVVAAARKLVGRHADVARAPTS